MCDGASIMNIEGSGAELTHVEAGIVGSARGNQPTRIAAADFGSRTGSGTADHAEPARELSAVVDGHRAVALEAEPYEVHDEFAARYFQPSFVDCAFAEA